MADCDLMIKLQRAMISLNKHERFKFKVRCCAASVLSLPENCYISAKGDTCWQRMNQLTG